METKNVMSLNEWCIEAAIAMNRELRPAMDATELPKHVQYVQFVSWEDTGGRTGWYPEKLVKVTIEWVDESEADPKNFESGITTRAVDGASCSCPVNSADTTLICQQCGLSVSPRN